MQEAIRGATETALLGAGNEVSKLITEDPGQSVDSAISDIGLSGLIGGGLGAGFGGSR